MKFGLSLSSFSSEYIHRKMSLEDILKKSEELGYRGVEFMPAQMAPIYPQIPDEWLFKWKELQKKHSLESVCWAAYLDKGAVTGAGLSDNRLVQTIIHELIQAKKAGFPIVRIQPFIKPSLMKEILPFCRDLDVKLAIELEDPQYQTKELWQEYFQFIKGEGKGYLGLVPDLGMFLQHPHKLWLQQAIDSGFRRDRLYKCWKRKEQGVLLEDVVKGLKEHEAAMIKELYECFSHPLLPASLQELLDLSLYIRGKFFFIDEKEGDTSIPYRELMKVLSDANYQGYITCDYEGYCYTDRISAENQLRLFIESYRPR